MAMEDELIHDGPDVHDELCPVTTRGGGRMYPTTDDGRGCWVCDGLGAARAHQHHATRQRVLTALLDARDREPHALWSLAKVIELVDGATR